MIIPGFRLASFRSSTQMAETGIYGKIHYKNIAVGVIPIDEDWIPGSVGQYRFPLDLYSWEIPEGGGSMREDPIEAAKRELLEETGLIAKDGLKS